MQSQAHFNVNFVSIVVTWFSIYTLTGGVMNTGKFQCKVTLILFSIVVT